MFNSSRLFYNVAPYTDRVAANVMNKLRYQGFEVDGIKMPSAVMVLYIVMKMTIWDL